MKTILILSNDHAYTYDLRKEIIMVLLEKYHVYVAVPNGEKIPLLKEMGCTHIPIELEKRGKNPFHDLKLFRDYDKIIKRIHPDLILSYTIKPNVYGGLAAQKNHVPQIANITGLGTAIENKGILQVLTVLLQKAAFRKISCVFFQNRENQQFFERKRICHAPFELLPGSGVNIEEYRYLSYPQQDAIEFLFISRIMKEKGIEEYILAAEAIRAEYPFAHFHVLGSCNPEYKDIIRNAESRTIIQYHGKTNDVIPFIKKSHCLIHPSYYPEGMSNVCLEAAASGRPVITTNRSGCRETVEDGVTGYIVETKNTMQLINTIKKFIGLTFEQKEQMGKRGRERMVEYFDRQKVVAAYNMQINKSLS